MSRWNTVRFILPKRLTWGGIAIYAALLLGISILIKPAQLTYFNVFIAASFIIAIVGVKDDLVGIDPNKKFIAQIAAALIMAWLGNVRISDFHGFLGVHGLSMPFSIAITVVIIVFICNAMNLIDGIDGLAGGIGLVASITYAICFYRMGHMGECMLSLGVAGALIGFLYYNVSPPAKIFMGDCGSLLIGFVLAVVSIRFVELNKVSAANPDPLFSSVPAIAIGILIIPFYDALRVFFLRIMRGKSPFAADKNHLHHRLVVYLRLSHLQASLLLVSANILFIGLAFSFRYIGSTQLVSLLFLIAMGLNIGLWGIKRAKKRKVVLNVQHKNILHEHADIFEGTAFKIEMPVN